MAAERASPARVRSPGRTRSPQMSGLSGRVDARQRLEGIGRLGTLPRPGSPGAARSVTPESRAASGAKSLPSRSPSPSSEPARPQPQALPLPTAEASPAAPDLAQLQARRRARARAPLGGAGVESVSGVSALVAQARGRDGDGPISEPTGQPAAGEHAETPAYSGPTNWELLGGSRRSAPMTMRGRVTPQLLGPESGTRTPFVWRRVASPWVRTYGVCFSACCRQAVRIRSTDAVDIRQRRQRTAAPEPGGVQVRGARLRPARGRAAQGAEPGASEARQGAATAGGQALSPVAPPRCGRALFAGHGARHPGSHHEVRPYTCAPSRRAADTDTAFVCSSTERNSPSPRRRGGVELNVSGRLSPGRSAARAKEMRARQASPKPWHRESTIASDGSLRTGRRGASPVRPRPQSTVALHPLSLPERWCLQSRTGSTQAFIERLNAMGTDRPSRRPSSRGRSDSSRAEPQRSPAPELPSRDGPDGGSRTGRGRSPVERPRSAGRYTSPSRQREASTPKPAARSSEVLSASYVETTAVSRTELPHTPAASVSLYTPAPQHTPTGGASGRAHAVALLKQLREAQG